MDGGIAECLDGLMRERLVGALELLEADDVGLELLQPPRQHVEARVDAVDVVAGDLQPSFLRHGCWNTREANVF